MGFWWRSLWSVTANWFVGFVGSRLVFWFSVAVVFFVAWLLRPFVPWPWAYSPPTVGVAQPGSGGFGAGGGVVRSGSGSSSVSSSGNPGGASLSGGTNEQPSIGPGGGQGPVTT